MYQTFFIGFTTGCCIGFILEWMFKQKRVSQITDVVEMNEEIQVPVLSTMSDDVNNYMLVLVINAELKMGEGKIVAQCAHAAVGTYEMYYKTHHSNFENWERQGKRVSMYQVSDTSTLRALYKSADDIGMITCLVKDAGRTQIAAGSSTVLAIGPEKQSIFNSITQHLLLYS